MLENGDSDNPQDINLGDSAVVLPPAIQKIDSDLMEIFGDIDHGSTAASIDK